jgi:hypothetical protein
LTREGILACIRYATDVVGKKPRSFPRLETKIPADENIAVVFVNVLKPLWHDVVRVVVIFPSTKDGKAFEFAIAEKRLLLTADVKLASDAL